MSAPAVRRAPGPARRFELAQIDRAALRVVERDGFAALSLRGVARELDLTPAALYTYLRTGDELRARVIDLVIAQHADDLSWPSDWEGVLRTFGLGMQQMLDAHPAMIEAFAAGAVFTPAARDVVEQVMTRLLAAGVDRDLALHGYAAVHAVVLGHSLLHSQGQAPDETSPVDGSRHPTLAGLAVEGLGGLGGLDLQAKVELVIAGMRARLDATARPRRRRQG